MSGTAPAASDRVDSAAELSAGVRQALRDLLLALADTKRLLGIRYADWMLSAPTIESGIAASSMAQDEWGHSRLTYALLSDFGDEPRQLEHERSAAEYRSSELLDRPLESWSDLIALALLLDTALSVQYQALLGSLYAPVHNRVQKMLDEERFHFQHAAGWTRRLAQAGTLRDQFLQALQRTLPASLRWLGREEQGRLLVEAGLVSHGPEMLRERLLATVGQVLEDGGFTDALRLTNKAGRWVYEGELDWSEWNDILRRTDGAGPDPETLARIRGDRNRIFLME
jgi:ring-1,2-phenylacetyl-CoA epoxidase subunit PaaC